MNYKKYPTKKAQILLITLLILTILSLITVTVVLVNSRDLAEVSNNKKYDVVYNGLEDKVKELIRTFGRYETSISTLASAPYNCFQLTPSQYDCDFSIPAPTLTISSQVLVSNSKNYEDYQVFKDRGLEININGYKDNIDFYWEKQGLPASEQASLEFILIYRDIAGNYRFKNDVYNPTGIYSSAPASANPFVYSENPAYPGNAYARRINFTSTLADSDIPEKLVVIPRMSVVNGNIGLYASPTNPGIFPDQVRVFEGTGYDNNDSASPVVNIVSQIPIYPQTLGLLDYALLTQGAVSLN